MGSNIAVKPKNVQEPTQTLMRKAARTTHHP